VAFHLLSPLSLGNRKRLPAMIGEELCSVNKEQAEQFLRSPGRKRAAAHET
jgi:hypothetical protein